MIIDVICVEGQYNVIDVICVEGQYNVIDVVWKDSIMWTV